MKPKILDAVLALDPNAVGYGISGGVLDLGENVNNITESQIDTKLSELISEYDTLEYSRNRKAEYPDTGTQFNKIYDDGIDAWKADMVDPIKAKYPKP
jgi:hypothetical protein